MTTPLVSCILTCSSAVRVPLARKAVNNFIRQRYLPYELFIVNSTGQSILTHDKLGSGCRILEIPTHPGLNAASMRNTGLSVAQGDWVICIDDDDYFHPNRLLYQMAYRQEGRPCLLKYQLRMDVSQVINQATEDNPVYPGLHLLRRDEGISSTALFPRIDPETQAPWVFNPALNTGEYDELLAQMKRQGSFPVVFDNKNTDLVPDQCLPLLSIAVYHGANELSPRQFFEYTEPDTGLNRYDMEHLKHVLQLYDFQIK